MLRTEAQNGWSVGRIPRSKAKEYAIDDLGFEPIMVEAFCRIIYEMDSGYVDWVGKQKPASDGATHRPKSTERPARAPRAPIKKPKKAR